MGCGTGQDGMARLSENIKKNLSDTVSSILAGVGNLDGTPSFLFRASGSLDMTVLLPLDSVYEDKFLRSHGATDGWVLSGVGWWRRVRVASWVLTRRGELCKGKD
ncbi:hypothetical protein LX36DRAFT_711604 [Colletotrichum falcatum]|nr:hypothetical protein LX36DRAFT_711604 [Colletotrichum falcatum]